MLYYCCCETFPTFTNKIWQHMEIPHWVCNRRSLSKDLLLYLLFKKKKLLLNGTITTKWEMYDCCVTQNSFKRIIGILI